MSTKESEANSQDVENRNKVAEFLRTQEYDWLYRRISKCGDNGLSGEDLGLYAYLLGQPPGRITVESIARDLKWDEEKTHKHLIRLAELGFLDELMAE